MSAARRHILVLLLIAACVQAVRAQELTPADAVPAAQVDAQLEINRTALLEKKTPYATRVATATILLASPNPGARTVLLDVLAKTDNPGYRAAVCEALSLVRNSQQPFKNLEDFIKHLVSVITSEQDSTTVRLAAEAMLMFGYSQVQPELERAVGDTSLPVAARGNVIYAMRRHPDKQAVIRLVNLMDNPDPQIVEAARIALNAVGIAVSADPAARRQMLLELQQRSAEAFLREAGDPPGDPDGARTNAERRGIWKRH